MKRIFLIANETICIKFDILSENVEPNVICIKKEIVIAEIENKLDTTSLRIGLMIRVVKWIISILYIIMMIIQIIMMIKSL